MLTAFGIFWGAQVAGARWPGDDAALLVLVPTVPLYAWALSLACRRLGKKYTEHRHHLPDAIVSEWGRALVRLWYDFLASMFRNGRTVIFTSRS
jgi:hypothetical protein